MNRVVSGCVNTLGSHLRSCSWGNVRQLEAVNRRLLADLARRAPLLPGKDVLAFLDIDSMQKRVYGHRKQGAAFGHTKIQRKQLLVRGLLVAGDLGLQRFPTGRRRTACTFLDHWLVTRTGWRAIIQRMNLASELQHAFSTAHRCRSVLTGTSRTARGRASHARRDPGMGESAGERPVFAGRRTVGYDAQSLPPV